MLVDFYGVLLINGVHAPSVEFSGGACEKHGKQNELDRRPPSPDRQLVDQQELQRDYHTYSGAGNPYLGSETGGRFRFGFHGKVLEIAQTLGVASLRG